MAQPAPTAAIPPTAAPAAIPDTPPNPTDGTAPTSPQTPTFTQRLNAAEHLWIWKSGLRAITALVALIGLGALAWLVATHHDRGLYYDFEYQGDWALPWGIITFGISILWSALCILVLLLRRPNKPVHPGVAVAIDLILWLGYIGTAMLVLSAWFELHYYGSGGSMGYYSSSDGRYELQPNNTWTWQSAQSNKYDAETGMDRETFEYYYPNADYDAYIEKYYKPEERNCSSASNYYSSYDAYEWKDCAELDAYINQLWQEKPHRMNIIMLAGVTQWMCLVLHFVLFVWACVDTNRRNRGKVSKDAEKLAAQIVSNMVRSGQVVHVQNAGMQMPLLAHVQPPPAQGMGWVQQGAVQGMGMGWGQPGPVVPAMQVQSPEGVVAAVQVPQAAVVVQEKGEAGRFT